MRIIVVHNRYRSTSPSGENAVVEAETALLRSADHEVELYTAESDTIEGSSLPRKAMLPARLIWSTEDHHKMRRAIRAFRPDVVHIHNTFPLISPSVVHAARAERVATVATLHNFRLACVNGMLFREGGPCNLCVGHGPWSGVIHACYRDSRAASLNVALGITTHRLLGTWRQHISSFIALTEFAKAKLVASGLPADRIVVKPNFVYPVERSRPAAGRHVLFMGRLSAEKGVHLLLDAWAGSSIPLVVAGDGPEREALEAHASAIGGAVTFVGNQPREVCNDLLRDARVLAVPSLWYEGFPMVVAEAYANGVPVIAPAHGSFLEIVRDGVTGRLFQPLDAGSLTLALHEVTDPQVSESMGREAKDTYERLYTPARNLEALLHTYEDAIDARSRTNTAPSAG